MNLNRRLLLWVKSSKILFGLTVLINFLSGVLIIFWAQNLSQIINHVFMDGWTLQQVTPYLEWLMGVVIIRCGLLVGGEMCATALAVEIKTKIRQALLAQLMRLGPTYVQRESSGALAASALQGVEFLDSYFSQYLPQLLITAFLPLLILIMVFPLDWVTGIVLMITAPLIPFFMILIGKTSENLTRKQFGALRRMSAYFLDTLQGLTTLKQLNQSRKQAKKIADVGEAYRQTTMSVLRLTFLSSLVLEWLATLSVAVVAVEIGVRLLSGGMHFGDAFFILVIAPEFYLPLRMLGLRFHASASGVSAANKIFEVLDEVTPQSNGLETGPDGLKLQQFCPLTSPPTIKFREVNFTYPGRTQAALSGVTLDIPGGQQTALVGKSGSGKSTIVNLLLGLLSPRAGQIYINEVNLSGMPVEKWRSNMAWISQQPFLFNATLRENISIGKPQANLEEIWQAACQVHLEEWINTLPSGLDTWVGEKGARLSGGQVQRVALARAFLKNAPILIMDEPTAHIDPDLEESLIEMINKLCRGKTVLTIAHRLPTVVDCDQIIVLDYGMVVGQGRHATLLKQNQQYAALIRAYSEGGR